MFSLKLESALGRIDEGVEAKLAHLTKMILKDPRIDGNEGRARQLILGFVDVSDPQAKMILEKYLDWILQQWMRHNVNLGAPWEDAPPEDRDRIVETMSQFHDLKKRGLVPLEFRDIGKKEVNFRKLETEVERLTGTRSKREAVANKRGAIKDAASSLVYDDTKYRVLRIKAQPPSFSVVVARPLIQELAELVGADNVYKDGLDNGVAMFEQQQEAQEIATAMDPHTSALVGRGVRTLTKDIPNIFGVRAAMSAAQGTSWCTAGYENAVYYLKKGPLFICYKDGSKYWQADAKFEEFRNVQDDPLAVCSPALDWMLSQFVTIELPPGAAKGITRFRLRCKDYPRRPPVMFNGQQVTNSGDLGRADPYGD